MALRCQALVVSISYRLAPEFAHPTAFDDCWAVCNALVLREEAAEHLRLADAIAIDYTCVFIGGDSAGGTLAISMARRLSSLAECPLHSYTRTCSYPK